MSGTFSGLSIAKSGLFAQRAAMEVTSNNIANSNTEGYTRQRAILSSRKAYLLTGVHTSVNEAAIGNGVSVDMVEATRDVYMNAKIIKETSTNSFNDTCNTLLKQIEEIINEPGTATIADQLDQYWAAWQDLANDPSDTSIRRNLIEETNSLITMFQNVDDQLRDLQGKLYNTEQGSIENQIQDTVKEINELGQYIADLNRDIARSEVCGQQANELRDKRQVALEELSKLINVESFYNTNGELTVSCGTHTLVQHEYFHGVGVDVKAGDLGSTVSGSTRGYPEYSDNPDVATAVLDHTISQNNITLTVSQTATAHSQYSFLTYHPLTGPLSDFGITSGSFVVNGRTFYLDAENTTMKDLAKTLDEANLNLDAYINESGQLILDAEQTGTEYAICTADGTSNLFTVLNLQDQRVAQDCIFNFGNKEYVTSSNNVSNVIEGVTLVIKNTGVATMDLRPTVTSGKLKALLETRDGIIDEALCEFNKLAYSVMTETNAIHRNGYGLDAGTGRNFFKSYDSGNPDNPYEFAIQNMSLEDFITGDIRTIACAGGTYLNDTDRLRTYNGDGDGSNAILIAQLKQKCLFNEGKSTFNDYYNEIVTRVAAKSQRYEAELTYSNNIMTQLESQRSAQAGVSMDEELSNLIKFQQAYNASAKCITVIDEMLDKVINGMI
mgnify:CR=1 FL=1